MMMDSLCHILVSVVDRSIYLLFTLHVRVCTLAIRSLYHPGYFRPLKLWGGRRLQVPLLLRSRKLLEEPPPYQTCAFDHAGVSCLLYFKNSEINPNLYLMFNLYLYI